MALKNLLKFLVKMERVGAGEIALASSEGREMQINSETCLNDLESRGQKWIWDSLNLFGATYTH